MIVEWFYISMYYFLSAVSLVCDIIDDRITST